MNPEDNDPNPLNLTGNQERELYRLWRYYGKEADRCWEARAFLAGCAMLGARLETALVLMVNVYPEEAIATGKAPKRKNCVRPLLEWDLAALLGVAKAAGWLPARLALDDDWDHRRAQIGDHAEVVRMIRNLLHPARYVEDHFGKRITKKHLSMVFETIDAANTYLVERVTQSLAEKMREEEQAALREDDQTA